MFCFRLHPTLLLIGLCLLWLPVLHAQPLPRSTPEAEGVPSQAIIDWIEALNNSPHEMHGYVFVRNGKVISEGWWAPYAADLKHTMYSASKSFTSTAVGFAVQEKRLSLDDKVISFFPDQLPDSVSPNLAALTVKDLLTMSVGHATEPTRAALVGYTSWAEGFLAWPVVHKPGTKFLYNSLSTYMAGLIVQKLTHQTLTEYLEPRLFAPLGITGVDWEIDPMGYNVGGWGMRSKTEDMAKLGLLYLQKGVWNGQQLLTPEWVAMATSAQIIQNPDKPLAERQSSDWEQGYGFQFWQSLHGYRGDGAYGQYILVLPEHNAVLAINSETQNMQGILNEVWKHIEPAFKPKPIRRKAKSQQALADLHTRLKWEAPASTPSPSLTDWHGKTIILPQNNAGISRLTLHFFGDQLTAVLDNGRETQPLLFGRSQWLGSETYRRGPNLLTGSPTHMAGLGPVKYVGAFAWTGPQTLELTLRFIESPHHERIKITRTADSVEVQYIRSDRPQNPVQVMGKME